MNRQPEKVSLSYVCAAWMCSSLSARPIYIQLCRFRRYFSSNLTTDRWNAVVRNINSQQSFAITLLIHRIDPIPVSTPIDLVMIAMSASSGMSFY